MIRQTTTTLFALALGSFAVAQAAAPTTNAVDVVVNPANPTNAANALPRTAAPAGAKEYIISPKDGATVKSPVTIQFGLHGMGVAPAGVTFDNTGHHHLLIDTDLPADTGLPLPATDKIVHFGKGQTEASITLTPGKHTLQLVLGDHLHIPFYPVISSPKITITVAP